MLVSSVGVAELRETTGSLCDITKGCPAKRKDANLDPVLLSDWKHDAVWKEKLSEFIGKDKDTNLRLFAFLSLQTLQRSAVQSGLCSKTWRS